MLKIWANYVSQPSRTVLWCLKIKNLPFEMVKINPTAGEAETPDFLEKFPMGYIPAIEDGDFRLSEAPAILVYLAEKHQWNDWFPSGPENIQQRAIISQWLSWLPSLRQPATGHLFRASMLEKLGAKRSPEAIERDRKAAETGMKDAMLTLVHGGLNKQEFIAGSTVTLADFALYSELDQLEAMNLFDFAPYPEVVAWMARMKQIPHHDDVRQSLLRFAKM